MPFTIDTIEHARSLVGVCLTALVQGKQHAALYVVRVGFDGHGSFLLYMSDGGYWSLPNADVSFDYGGKG